MKLAEEDIKYLSKRIIENFGETLKETVGDISNNYTSVIFPYNL